MIIEILLSVVLAYYMLTRICIVAIYGRLLFVMSSTIERIIGTDINDRGTRIYLMHKLSCHHSCASDFAKHLGHTKTVDSLADVMSGIRYAGTSLSAPEDVMGKLTSSWPSTLMILRSSYLMPWGKE
jgi:hypothetical protein